MTKRSRSVSRGESSSQEHCKERSVKIVHVDHDAAAPAPQAIRCHLPPHRHGISFTSLDDYDVHYFKSHTNRCVACRRNFPSPHFLSLHQEEKHDPLAAIRRERGELRVRRESVHVQSDSASIHASSMAVRAHVPAQPSVAGT
jgi:hypothetical protein